MIVSDVDDAQIRSRALSTQLTVARYRQSLVRVRSMQRPSIAAEHSDITKLVISQDIERSRTDDERSLTFTADNRASRTHPVFAR